MVTIVSGGVKAAGAVLKSLMRPFVTGPGDSSDNLCVMQQPTPKQEPRPASITFIQTLERREQKKSA